MTATIPDASSDASEPPDDAEAPTARILERGYRHYEGERRGRTGAMRSVYKHTVRACLGLHRPARTKVFPILTIVLAYVPTLVYIGVTVIGNRLQQDGIPGRAMAEQFVPTYASLYKSVVGAVVLFAAFVAPEVLCPDRRNGMLGLYLAAPLRRTSYLVSKGLAVLSMVSIVTVGPPLLLLIGYATQGFGPNGVKEWFTTLGDIVWAGLTVAVMYTIVSLAISAVTSRKAAASAAFLAMIIGLPVLITYIVLNTTASSEYRLLDLATLPYEAVIRIFGAVSPYDLAGVRPVATSHIWLACGGWVLASLLVIADRYRRVMVTR